MPNDYYEGKASYYTNKSVDPRWGGYTKSGEKFDENALTVAVRPSDWKTLKGKTLEVTDVDTGKSVDVRVTDTGGFTKYGRVLDLSLGAFRTIADPKNGVTRVKYRVKSDSKTVEAMKDREKKDGNDKK